MKTGEHTWEAVRSLDSQINTRRTRSIKHRAVPSKREVHNLISTQKTGSRHGLEPGGDLCVLCVTETTADPPQTLLVSLSIYRTHLYRRCHTPFIRSLAVTHILSSVVRTGLRYLSPGRFSPNCVLRLNVPNINFSGSDS